MTQTYTEIEGRPLFKVVHPDGRPTVATGEADGDYERFVAATGFRLDDLVVTEGGRVGKLTNYHPDYAGSPAVTVKFNHDAPEIISVAALGHAAPDAALIASYPKFSPPEPKRPSGMRAAKDADEPEQRL